MGELSAALLTDAGNNRTLTGLREGLALDSLDIPVMWFLAKLWKLSEQAPF